MRAIERRGVVTNRQDMQGRRWLAVIAGGVLAILAALASGRAEAQCEDPLARLERIEPLLDGNDDSARLQEFYRLWGPGCAWDADAASALVAILRSADGHGLSPSAYLADRLEYWSRADDAERDLLLTAAALRYAHAMRSGRIDLARLYGDVSLHRWNAGAASELAAALRSGNLRHWLEALPPSMPEYGRLVQALARYRALAARGGWPVLRLPEGRKSLKPDETSPLVPALRVRLAIGGDIGSADGSETFDPDTVAAVSRFQERHGLLVDGIVGRDTLAALNVPAAARAEQIALNLERWRFMSYAMPPTRIEVNAASAEAVVMQDGEVLFRMKTIVGAKATPTPMLASAITRVIVNPPWVVPHSIYRGEIAPAIARDPDYLRKHDMAWQGAHIVQAPGSGNALGRLKFEFPSPFAVYLHDTNAPSLFASENRFRSHGCIRVERPMELALHLLAPSGWSRERLETLIAAEETVGVPVGPPMPVVVAYWTAFVQPDGTMEFRDDIYGRDAALKAALESAAPRLPVFKGPDDCGA